MTEAIGPPRVDATGVTKGWHPDPAGRHELRWHSGQAWTTAVMDAGLQGVDDPRQVMELPESSVGPGVAVPLSPPPAPVRPSDDWFPSDPKPSQGLLGPSIAALIAAGGLVIGSLLPWATATAPLVGTLNVAGTEGDGVIVIGIALLIALVAVLNLRPPIGTAPGVIILIAGVVALVVSGIDMGNVNEKVQEAEDMSQLVKADIGIGLYVCAISAIVAAGAGGAMLGRRRSSSLTVG